MSPADAPAPAPFTVVVCAFSSERLSVTVSAVESLLAQVPTVPSVVVVVDHNPKLEAQLRRLLPDTAEVVPNEGSQGLSGARNTGIARAAGAIVAFLDDDAVARLDWVENLSEAMADPSVLAAGGHAIPNWVGEPPDHFPEEFLWVVGCSYRGLPESGEVRNVLGCNMAIRTDVFKEVGGFDPAIGRFGSKPLGCEETELCIRALRRFSGGRVILVGNATVKHLVPRTRQRFEYFRKRCFYEGVSKALIRRLSGERALEAERQYTRKTLTAAATRELANALRLRGTRTALLRVAWICTGLGSAVVGFTLGSGYYLVRPPERHPPLPAGG